MCQAGPCMLDDISVSRKCVVVEAWVALNVQVLEHWHAGGHRALLFAQTQQMLDILEKSIQVTLVQPHTHVQPVMVTCKKSAI